MDAAELLVLLESMQDRNIPLHKYIVRVEVSDTYYNKNVSPEQIKLITRTGSIHPNTPDGSYLVIEGD